MIVVGAAIVAFGMALIFFRASVRRGIENKGKRIGNPMISRSVKRDGVRQVAEAGVIVIVIGIAVILEAVGVFQ